RGVTILVSEPGYETVGSKDLTCEDWMVNTRTDADLSAAVQNALQTLLPQIREEIREEFRTGSGSSNAGGNPPPNKQKPHSFEKATVLECLKREYHSIRQTSSETSTEFMQRFLRLAGFLRAAAVANAARNYEILHERDDVDTERPDKRGVTIMVTKPGYETVGSKDLTCEDWMVNTRTDAYLSVAVQNTLQTLLPQIHAEIREEFRTSFGPSDAGGNPAPVTIHTWLERFNKQKPHSFEKATAPMDAENWISHMEKIFDVMGSYKQAKGGDAWLITVTWADFKKLFYLQFFPRAEQERLKREYQSIRQTNTETSTKFMQCFLRLAGFLGAAAGTEEEQAKNFQWGLRRSTLNYLMCMSYTDVAQVANAACKYEILHERDDDDTERPDKRQKSGDRHQPTSQQSSHRNHGHNNDRHGSDRRSGGDNHRINNNYSGSNNRLNFKSIQSSSTHKHDPNHCMITGIPVMGVTRETGVSSPTDLPILVASSPGVPLRATPSQFALHVDADTQESVVELLVDVVEVEMRKSSMT
nr:hypothetical protein [Tanacetum cinerariifolium]